MLLQIVKRVAGSAGRPPRGGRAGRRLRGAARMQACHGMLHLALLQTYAGTSTASSPRPLAKTQQ